MKRRSFFGALFAASAAPAVAKAIDALPESLELGDDLKIVLDKPVPDVIAGGGKRLYAVTDCSCTVGIMTDDAFTAYVRPDLREWGTED